MGRRPDPLFWCIISITFATISIVAAIATVILSCI